MDVRCLAPAVAVAAFALGSFSTAAPAAQEYPSHPIHLIVPTAAGGAADLVARQVGERLGLALHTTVVVANKPGASGVIGSELVAHAAPDGYTLLFATSATQVINAYVMGRLPYDPVRDFTPVINLGYVTSVIVVSPALPVHTIGELVAYARARPGTLNYASSGTGSANHIDTEVFAALAGIQLVHIPYRGTADGYRALLSNEVQLMFGSITSALPYVLAGTLRALAVLVDRRSPLLPDVPTIAQAGFGSVDVRKWFGILAPAGTPPGIVQRLNGTLDGILHEPEMRDWLQRQGVDPGGGSTQDFDQVLRADYVRWGGMVRQLNLRSR